MTRTTYLGFPRIGQRRELKRALETYWRDSHAAPLLDTARELRQRHWRQAKAAGIDTVAVNDFSLYDHVLDTALLFDAVPEHCCAVIPWPAISRWLAATATCMRWR
jgi:5-methyltetrahydropteroyltriglutamate--homocysteine methyltransferase